MKQEYYCNQCGFNFETDYQLEDGQLDCPHCNYGIIYKSDNKITNFSERSEPPTRCCASVTATLLKRHKKKLMRAINNDDWNNSDINDFAMIFTEAGIKIEIIDGRLR